MRESEIRQLEIELSGRKILDRLKVKPGCENMAWTATQAAARRLANESSSFGPDDDYGLDLAAAELQAKNPALFGSELPGQQDGTKSVAQMTATEREADLKKRGII